MSRNEQEKIYAEAETSLSAGRLLIAEGMLRKTLDQAPRAAQMMYLLGITVFMQGRIGEARRLIDHAFEVKAWLREPGVEIGLERALVEFADECPDWEWVRYERLVRKWTAIGFTFPRLVEACLANTDPFLLQIGANDGESGDPLLALFERHEWHGVLLEPMREPFEALSKRHEGRENIVLVNKALADHDGTLDLFTAESSRTTLASALPERNVLSKERRALDITSVGCITFETLMDQYGIERVDLLQIDTEGMDGAIIRSFDLERLRPAIIQLEFYCLPLYERVEVMERLDRNRYAWRFIGRDLLAVDRDAVPRQFCVGHNETLW